MARQMACRLALDPHRIHVFDADGGASLLSHPTT
jgi:hypothetical protein